VKCSLAMRMEF